ncbi:MAG TPA: MOSC N-terminal beta barrel domain-containing protein [Vicinamibacterales bacterium]|jgi:uncharacterized protein YcbX|nr:MOSC N-terminal beta barrel domain-containing protein [Vicinamibacterales bacterium]
MIIQEIWRYPVKSMGGELLRSAILQEGILGDRVIQVQSGSGRTVTARAYPGLLGLRAVIDERGVPLVDGLPWTDPQVLEAVRAIVGPEARLVRDESLDRFDILPLLVATDGAISAFGRDGRRLRPNIVVGGVDGLEERTWPGSHLMVGDAVIRVHDLRGRCIMTTFDPDTLAHDPGVLRDIGTRFGGKLALNCDVVRGGQLEIGQRVTIRQRGQVPDAPWRE